MKKLIVIVAVLVSGIVNAQNDSLKAIVTTAVSFNSVFDKDTSFHTDHLYLQDQFVDLIRSENTKKILSIVHEEKFSVFTKTTFKDDIREYQYLKTDSEIISVLSEIQNNLPSFRAITVTNVYKHVIDDFIVNTYAYTNIKGQKCEVRVYFCNGQINNLNYTVF